MKRFSGLLVKVSAVASLLVLGGCGALNNQLADKTKQVEYYRIFDIKTDDSRRVISEAASNGLGRNVNNARETTPIPNGPVPDQPGRFQLSNPLAGTQLGAFMHVAGGGLAGRIATCENAVWTADAVRRVDGSDNLKLTLCLFQYKGGYHLNMYAVFQKKTGGLLQVSRNLAHAVVGTPEEWTERTMLDVVRSINLNTKSEVVLLEAEPEIVGTPWTTGFDR